MDEEKIFEKDTYDKGLLPKVYKEPLKLIKERQTPLKQIKDLNRYLTKDDIQKPNQHMKRCSTQVFREMQIKKQNSELPLHTLL